MRRISNLIAGVLLLSPASLWAGRITPPKPLFTEVFLRIGADRERELSGNLIDYDEQSFTLKTNRDSKELKWSEITPSSAFTLRSRLIDKTRGVDWLSLARFGWSMGATDQAKVAIDRAVSLDASLKSQADQITSSPAGAAASENAPASEGTGAGVAASPHSEGSAAASPAAPVGPDEPTAANRELIGSAGHTIGVPVGGAGSISRPDDGAPDKPTALYQKSTPAEDAAAIATDKIMAASLEDQLKVHFTTIETPHFLLFTDWDPREFDFLKQNLEDAYTAVSAQFNIPASDNVFVGKLPVFMFARYSDYAKLTDSIGFLGRPASRSVRGYYQGWSNGFGRLVMYKPSVDEKAEAEKQWAHALVHEFTHAFVARYHSNAHVPRWLNEGIAEVIAARSFSFDWTYPEAQRMAAEHRTAGTLFDDSKLPTGDWYPVMQTMVEYLISENKAGFLQMFDAIKAGMDGQDALKKYFNMDYDQLMQRWRAAVLRHG